MILILCLSPRHSDSHNEHPVNDFLIISNYVDDILNIVNHVVDILNIVNPVDISNIVNPVDISNIVNPIIDTLKIKCYNAIHCIAAPGYRDT